VIALVFPDGTDYGQNCNQRYRNHIQGALSYEMGNPFNSVSTATIGDVPSKYVHCGDVHERADTGKIRVTPRARTIEVITNRYEKASNKRISFGSELNVTMIEMVKGPCQFKSGFIRKDITPVPQ